MCAESHGCFMFVLGHWHHACMNSQPTKLIVTIVALQFADSIGMPTDEGYFGFKPFSEVSSSRSCDCLLLAWTRGSTAGNAYSMLLRCCAQLTSTRCMQHGSATSGKLLLHMIKHHARSATGGQQRKRLWHVLETHASICGSVRAAAERAFALMQVWCGRWAMMGFVISIYEEAVTGERAGCITSSAAAQQRSCCGTGMAVQCCALHLAPAAGSKSASHPTSMEHMQG